MNHLIERGQNKPACCAEREIGGLKSDQLSQMTNEELALSYVEGNNRAFDELLRRTQSSLFSYILFVVRDQETANDIFQETFVKVIMKLHHGKYSPSGRFAAWLVRIAHNVIMDWYRDNHLQNVMETTDKNDFANMSNDELLERNIENDYVKDQVMDDVRQLMNGLPPVQREVVYMRYFQELSFREIAESTGVSINTSLGRMRYAMINMRRMARQNHLELSYE